jgi:MFS family permease
MTRSLSARRILGFCSLTHATQDGISVALNLVLPLLAQSFGLGYAQVGLLRAMKSAVMVLFEIPGGVLSERWGERRLLVFGLFCVGVGALLLPLARNLAVVMLAFVAIGIGNAFQHALCSAIISTRFDTPARRGALGLYNSAGDAGKLGFSGLIALTAWAGMGWQGSMGAFGLVTLLFAGLLWWFFSKASVGNPTTAAAHTASYGTGWGIRDRSGFLRLCLTSFLDTMVQSGFMVFVVFVFLDKDAPANWAGFALVLSLIGGMFGKAGCGILAGRLGPKPAFVLAQLATALGLIGLGLLPLLPAFVLLPFLGMFLQGSTSITYGSVSDLFTPARQSRGFALIYAVSGISAVFGPVLFGLLADSHGLAVTLTAMAVLALLAIPPALTLKTPG